MSPDLSEEDIKKIRLRCEAATPGPWVSSWEGRDHPLGGDSVILRGDQRQFDDLYITPPTPTDQDFIAHARQDIPMLVDEILRLRKKLEEASLDID
jgi:hypothetical protein